MISYNQKLRIILFLVATAVMLLLCGVFIQFEMVLSRNVEVISSSDLTSMQESSFIEPEELLYYGQKAVVDADTGNIFVCCTPQEIEDGHFLRGLATANPACRLFLLEQPSTADISLSVANNIPLTLIATLGDRYQKLNLVVTYLPLISLYCDEWYLDEYGRDAYAGSFCLFDAESAAGHNSQTISGAVSWRIRGQTSSSGAKKPWRLEIKKMSGSSSDADLLGMGLSDDWILNPMVFDDLKLREKLGCDFWNEYLYEEYTDYKMSEPKYVELFMNNDYRGVYLLQRRTDEELLPINKERDIIIKGLDNGVYTLQTSCEIVYSPFDSEITYEILDKALNFEDGNIIHKGEFINTSLYINCISGGDNSNYKNMFYVLCPGEEGYEVHFVPWDTDFSFGVVWDEKRASRLDYELSIQREIKRRELPAFIEQYPEIEHEFAVAWAQLRESIYTEENLLRLAEENYSLLKSSGVMIRDEQRWGLHNNGEDSYETLCKFINERLANLDRIYSDKLDPTSGK